MSAWPRIGELFYLLLPVYGLAIDMDDRANFVPVNGPTTGCTSGWASG